MKQARDYRKYNVRLTSADWQRGSGRVIKNMMVQKKVSCRARNIDITRLIHFSLYVYLLLNISYSPIQILARDINIYDHVKL